MTSGADSLELSPVHIRAHAAVGFEWLLHHRRQSQTRGESWISGNNMRNQVICFSAVCRPASHILVSSRVFLCRAATSGGWMEPDRELSPLAHKECSRILKSVRHVAKGLLSGSNQTAAHVWLQQRFTARPSGRLRQLHPLCLLCQQTRRLRVHTAPAAEQTS